MKRRMKKANKLDEMQEHILLHIESRGFWLAFWGLFAALIIQSWLLGGELQQIAGEWIVFLVVSLYIFIACLKNGIWDRKLSATPRTNLIFSLIVAGIVAIITFATSYYHFHKLYGAIAAGIMSFIWIFVSSFALLMISLVVYKKRVSYLEKENTDV